MFRNASLTTLRGGGLLTLTEGLGDVGYPGTGLPDLESLYVHEEPGPGELAGEYVMGDRGAMIPSSCLLLRPGRSESTGSRTRLTMLILGLWDPYWPIWVGGLDDKSIEP